MVTDDGEFLILLVEDIFEKTALVVYKRHGHPGQPLSGVYPDRGTLVGNIALAGLWPAEKMPSSVTDHTPKWYSEGSFSFSTDNRNLVYVNPWGEQMTIALASGKVTKK